MKIPLEEVKEEWRTEYGPTDIQTVAEHYGIYEHLFNGATFVPVVPLQVSFDYDDEYITPVLRGNRICPAEVNFFTDFYHKVSSNLSNNLVTYQGN